MERSGDTGRRNGNRPYTFIADDTAEDECKRVYGVLEREE